MSSDAPTEGERADTISQAARDSVLRKEAQFTSWLALLAVGGFLGTAVTVLAVAELSENAALVLITLILGNTFSLAQVAAYHYFFRARGTSQAPASAHAPPTYSGPERRNIGQH